MSAPKPTHCLARQIAGIVLLAQVLCALGLSVSTLDHERRIRQRSFDVQLQGHSDSLLGAIQDAEDPDDNVTVDQSELRLPSRDVYAVYGTDGRLIGCSKEAPRDLLALQQDGFRSMRSRNVSYRLLQRPGLRIIDRSENNGVGLRRPVTILYASPEGHIWHEVLEAASFDLAAIAFAATCSVLLVLAYLRRALRPLSALAEHSSRITTDNLYFTTPASVKRLKELAPLGDALEDTVARLRGAFENEKRFFGDAAHELKTAVAVVKSSLQVLTLRDRCPLEYRSGLEHALTDTDRVEKLVAQMLRLSNIEEAEEQDGNTTNLSLATEAICRIFKTLAETRQVSLKQELAPDLLIRVLPERVDTLLSNLLMNAIQHSASGSSVLIRTTGESGLVRLEVIDSGRGISKEALPYIFERFYREDASRSRVTGGAGLGLPICKAIVEKAGGTIAVQSQQRAGTTFTVIFTQT